METAHVQKQGLSHHKIYTDIVIDAAPEQVWEVLTDTASYPNWAAFMVDVKGPIADGQTLTLAFQLNPAKAKRNMIDHKISVTPGESFYWAEKGPGGICDNHHFRVERTEDGKTRFVQTDELRKGLTWLMGGYLAKLYQYGFQAFNQSLKAEVERRFAA